MDLTQDISAKTKRVLIYLPAGIITTPANLFSEFSSASLARHGIRRVTNDRTYVNIDQGLVKHSNDPVYCVRVAQDQYVTQISANSPIKYLGFKKWKLKGMQLNG